VVFASIVVKKIHLNNFCLIHVPCFGQKNSSACVKAAADVHVEVLFMLCRKGDMSNQCK
jgi:hypothetical protein